MATTWGVREMKELTEATRKKRKEAQEAKTGGPTGKIMQANGQIGEQRDGYVDYTGGDMQITYSPTKPTNASPTIQAAAATIAGANDRKAMVASTDANANVYTPNTYAMGQPGNWIATGADGTETQAPMYDAAGNVHKPTLQQAAQNYVAQQGQAQGAQGGALTPEQLATVQQMIGNASAWQGAGADQRKALEDANARLGASIPGAYRGTDGTWYYNGGDLFSLANGAGQVAGQTTGTAPGQGYNGTTSDYGMYNTVQQMIRNGQAWGGADAAERARLEAENQRLGATIPGAYRTNDGTWMIGDQNLFDMQYRVPQVTAPALDYGSYAQDANVTAALQQAAASRNRLADWDSFSYDPETDPLWAQYQNAYARGGQRAMQDTLGQMAARTGGLASSYAGTAAQQSYNNYMSQMADKLPELQQAAYQRYLGDYSRAKDLYGIDSDLLQMTLGQYNADRNFAYQQARDSVADQQWNAQFGYQAGRDMVGDQRYATEWQHGLDREAVEDQRYETEYADQQAAQLRAEQAQRQQYVLSMAQSGAAPTAAMLEWAGMDPSALPTLQAIAQFVVNSSHKVW